MTAQLVAVAALADRLDALGSFVRSVEGHVPGDALPAARALAERGTARLRLSGSHTVVALAGSTGGGKSSLLNALARMLLSPVGHLRPTTAEAHACVWGPEGADVLLDWLGVNPSHRFARESALDAEDEAALRGLVLLDLPDMDSVATGHRIEADRLVGVVDLVIWVLDPQKYADRTVHEDYLGQMNALREVTVVVLNQVDRLTPADAARCRADLARLLEADGLPDVPIIATSAITGDGVGEVRTLLEKTVAGRLAALTRLEGELDEAVTALAPLVGPPVAADTVSRDLLSDLSDELAAASAIPAVVAEVGRGYARRAALPGWPLRRGARMPRGQGKVPLAQPAAVAFALRHFADRAAAGLPLPWPEEVRRAACTYLPNLPQELGSALLAACPPLRRHLGWALLRTLWWLAAAVALGGAGWLGWYGLERAQGRVAPAPPEVSGVWVPLVLITGGLLVAALLILLGRPLASALTRRSRRQAERRLRDATSTVARERVVVPARAAFNDYAHARAALAAAVRDARAALAAAVRDTPE